MNWLQVPLELRLSERWINWRYERREGVLTKVPYMCRGKGKASSTDPSTWGAFSEAVERCNNEVGLGFVLGGGFAGIDLDDCVGQGGEFFEQAELIAQRVGSYTEASPSGEGLHVICRADLGDAGGHRAEGPWGGHVEMYWQKRYFTVTGRRLGEYPPCVMDRQQEYAAVHEYLMDAADTEGIQSAASVSQAADIDDEELLEKAFAADNGEAVRSLFAGGWQQYPSRSEADMALAAMLAFWTGRDLQRLQRLMCRSDLRRDKWHEKRGRVTYLEYTCRKVLGEAGDEQSSLRDA